MKTADYVTVGFIALFVTIIAYFSVNSLLGDPRELSVKFEYLDGVTINYVLPSDEVFNAGAINPTVEVYVGSCADLDMDGELNDDEKRACKMDQMKTDIDQTQPDYLQENNGLSNEENDAINSEQGYANGTTDQQRRAVEEDVNRYEQNQNNSNEAENPARQETVSGS